MKNPFEDMDSAFEVMYTEPITMKTVEGVCSLNACVMTDGTIEPLADEILESDVEQITILLKKTDWCLIDKIKRGDEITLVNSNKKYAVSDLLNDFALGWIIKARTK